MSSSLSLLMNQSSTITTTATEMINLMMSIFPLIIIIQVIIMFLRSGLGFSSFSSSSKRKKRSYERSYDVDDDEEIIYNFDPNDYNCARGKHAWGTDGICRICGKDRRRER